MASQDITLLLNERKQIRKGLNKFRQSGLVPAVIHDPGKDSIIVSGAYPEVLKVYHQAGKHHLVNIKVGDKTYLTIVKDVNFEPTKHTLRHVVFDIIKQTEKVETEVPIVLIGEDPPAQKAGLLVMKQLDHVQLEAYPKDLPDEVTVNQEGLVEIGDKITIADIIVPSGVTILTEPERSIAVVEEPKAPEPEEVEEEVTAEEGEKDTEGTEEASAEGDQKPNEASKQD